MAKPQGDSSRDAIETVVEVPLRAEQTGDTLLSGPVAPVPPSGTATGSITPAQAQRLDELARLRTMTRVLRWLSVAMLVTIPFVGGNPWLRYVLLGGLALGIPMGYWFEHLISTDQLDRKRMRMVAIGLSFNGFVGIAYFGIFSGASTLAVIGIFIGSRVEFLGSAKLIYAMCASFQAILTTLVIAGVVDDPGLITAERPLYEQVFMQVFIQVMYIGSYLVGVTARSAETDAVGRLERARRVAREREAQLHEARQDLDRALQVAVPGRHTDETFGSFRLGFVIGRGAMAEVYEATDTKSGELAAVKLLHPHMLSEPRIVTRFLREARAAATLDSPHVARVLEASDPLAPIPYLAMERLYGRDLAARLRETPRLSMRDVVEIVQQVGEVIDLAKGVGIVHRDLKPQNLFWSERPDGSGVWKVLDFGVSVLAEGTGTLTQGHMVGTPAYMAAEQARGREVDHRADIHSLAAIAYRCLTGRPPFPGRDLPAVIYAAVHTMPERPSELCNVPPDVDAALAIGLSKKASERYDDAASFARALAQAVRGQLDTRWRERAAAIVAAHPWGVSMSERASRQLG